MQLVDTDIEVPKITNVGFKRLTSEAVMPKRATSQSAGFDLYAVEDTMIRHGAGTVPVKTDIAVKLPPGTYGRIAIRSGLAFKEHLAVNAGVIDADYYPGDIRVLVFSTKPDPRTNDCYYKIKKGERFAQIIIEKINYDNAYEITDTEDVKSAHSGFGSTGKN